MVEVGEESGGVGAGVILAFVGEFGVRPGFLMRLAYAFAGHMCIRETHIPTRMALFGGLEPAGHGFVIIHPRANSEVIRVA